VAALPPAQQTLWQDLLGAANHHVATGVVAANNQQHNRYWRHWCTFLPPHIDPYLQDTSREQQLILLQAFIEWTRRGKLGRGNQVKANSVQDAVAAIGKTFELAGLPNPLYPTNGNKYHLRIARQLESFRRTDPPARPQLAVPVGIPNWIFRSSRGSQCPQVQAIGELSLMAFYFLLCVGEYTQATTQCSTRTQAFRLQDVKFYKNQAPITFKDLLANPCLPDLVRLKIDNQKNGRRGQIISHHAISIDCCPVKAVAARVCALLVAGAAPATLICAYQPSPQSPLLYISNDNIVTAVRTAIKHSRVTKDYDPEGVGSHSLRAGGAMALFQSGADATTIMKLGRWTSTAFMSYLHEQVDVLSRGAANRMATEIAYVNLDVSDAGPAPDDTLHTPPPR